MKACQHPWLFKSGSLLLVPPDSNEELALLLDKKKDVELPTAISLTFSRTVPGLDLVLVVVHNFMHAGATIYDPTSSVSVSDEHVLEKTFEILSGL